MNWVSYLLQINIYLILFYGFYALLLKSETFFQLNRLYLVGSAIVSLLIPVFYVDWIRNLFITEKIQQGWVISYEMVQASIVASPEAERWTLGDYLTLIYLTGLLIFVLRFIYSMFSMHKLLKEENKRQAFSFFNKIKIDPELPNNKAILLHEKAHVLHLHSFDILFFELLKIINWFNPVCYLYKKAIRHIHEFIADEQVIDNGIDKKEYALLLFSESFGAEVHQLSNSFFNKSLLKRRIQMLGKQKSKKAAVLKYGLSVPLFLAAMIFSSATINKSDVVEEITKKIEPQKELKELFVSGNLATTKEENKRAYKLIPSKSKLDIKSKKLKTVNTNSDSTTYMTDEVRVVGYSSGKANSDSVKRTSGNVDEHDYIFNSVSKIVLPIYPGGKQQLNKFIGKNLRYPSVARAQNTQGQVVVNFVVEKDGTLTEFKVLRGVSKELDEEALRVLKLSPKWEPGTEDDQLVRVSYSVPIMFRLEQNDPYILLDGKPISYDKMLKIDFETIESIDLLKDKNATDKYGDKGKNGVVIITLKKAENETAK